MSGYAQRYDYGRYRAWRAISAFGSRLIDAVLDARERKIEQMLVPHPPSDQRQDFEATSRAVCAGRE